MRCRILRLPWPITIANSVDVHEYVLVTIDTTSRQAKKPKSGEEAMGAFPEQEQPPLLGRRSSFRPEEEEEDDEYTDAFGVCFGLFLVIFAIMLVPLHPPARHGGDGGEPARLLRRDRRRLGPRPVDGPRPAGARPGVQPDRPRRLAELRPRGVRQGRHVGAGVLPRRPAGRRARTGGPGALRGADGRGGGRLRRRARERGARAGATAGRPRGGHAARRGAVRGDARDAVLRAAEGGVVLGQGRRRRGAPGAVRRVPGGPAPPCRNHWLQRST